MHTWIRRALACGTATLVLSVGCSARLTGGLDEPRTNDVLAALDAHGIRAEKRRESGPDPKFEVHVGHDDLGAALRVLASEGLPRRDDPGVAETYESSGLVPTASEERARYLAAMAGEMATTLERIDGVTDARVHFALPDDRARPSDEAPAPPRASVLIRTRPRARIERSAIAELVSGAVDGLDATRVSVVVVRASPSAANANSLARVGPWRVARGSAALLRTVASLSLVAHVLAALALVFVLARGRRRAPA